MAQAFKSSTREAEQLDLWFVGQPGLHNEFQDSRGYEELPCLLKKNREKNFKGRYLSVK